MLTSILVLFGVLLLAKAIVTTNNKKRAVENNKTKFRKKMKRN